MVQDNRQHQRHGRSATFPNHETIMRRAARIRAGWSDDERARRREISERVAQFWATVLTPCGE